VRNCIHAAMCLQFMVEETIRIRDRTPLRRYDNLPVTAYSWQAQLTVWGNSSHKSKLFVQEIWHS
jgi:hypothetical protein